MRLAQGLDQPVGLALERRQVGLDERLHLLVDGAVGLAARGLQLLVLRLQLGQRLAQRLDQLVDGLLALVEIVACHLLLLLETLFGELQQRLLVGLQRLAGQRLETLLQLLARGLQQLLPFLGGLLLGLHARAQLGGRSLLPVQAFA